MASNVAFPLVFKSSGPILLLQGPLQVFGPRGHNGQSLLPQVPTTSGYVMEGSLWATCLTELCSGQSSFPN